VRVPRQHVAGIVNLFEDVRSEIRDTIEVVGGTERAGLLDAATEGIVLEGRRSAVAAGDDSLCQAVPEVPCERAALGVGEGIAVCVIRVADPKGRSF
jgi:hypothetical protein